MPFWPWKGDDSSPAAFEKTLSDLSGRIGKASASLEITRQRGRRFKALWTLYASFAYLLYLMIAGLVVGLQSWGPIEYTAVAGVPVLIYGVRYALGSYYDYWTSSQQTHLQALQKQRDETITKLKEATKYNTTQQLLEKYGGGSPQKAASKNNKKERGAADEQISNAKRRQTTGFVPPPTANIPGRRIVSASVPASPQLPDGGQFGGQQIPPAPQSASAVVPPWAPQQPSQPPQQEQAARVDAGAEFAPNAFGEPRVYAPPPSEGGGGPKWYDRLMDVVLGEDESSPKNRIALVCRKCRLVNGQAPPGVRTLEELGTWKCSACGTMNGEESEARRLVADIQAARSDGPDLTPASPIAEEPDVEEDEEEEEGEGEGQVEESDHTVYSEEGEGDEGQAEEPRRSVRVSRIRGPAIGGPARLAATRK